MIIPKSFGINKCGIYCITNTVNGKFYIGSSKNIYYRLKRHVSDLNKGRHANNHLQNSYLKYGSLSFSVSIIEEVSYECLAETEQSYINNLKPHYNITHEVIRNTPSIESRIKISNTLKKQKDLGLLKYPSHNDKKLPVTIYDENCNCIGSYESQSAAAKKLSELYPDLKHHQSIVNSVVNLKSRRRTKKYKNHYIHPTGEKCSTIKQYRSDGKCVKVIDIISGQEYFFSTLGEAGKALNCHENSVNRSLVLSRLLRKRYKVVSYES